MHVRAVFTSHCSQEAEHGEMGSVPTLHISLCLVKWNFNQKFIEHLGLGRIRAVAVLGSCSSCCSCLEMEMLWGEGSDFWEGTFISLWPVWCCPIGMWKWRTRGWLWVCLVLVSQIPPFLPAGSNPCPSPIPFQGLLHALRKHQELKGVVVVFTLCSEWFGDFSNVFHFHGQSLEQSVLWVLCGVGQQEAFPVILWNQWGLCAGCGQ